VAKAAGIGAVAAGSAAAPGAVVGLAVLAAVISAVEEQAVTGKPQETAEALLEDLTERLKSALGDGLVSLVLYGSAAMGDRLDRISDLNVLCVLERITAAELAKSQAVFRWWLERGNPAPLLLTRAELGPSADCFPMEYHDMLEHRRVLHGVDLIQSLRIDPATYRTQVEHELRAKQIRLRQKAAELLTQADRLLKLLTHSISTFCVLGRHALILSGLQPRFKKTEVLAALETAMGRKLDSFQAILAARLSGKTAPGQTAGALLDGYLDEIDALVRFVDGLDRSL
jgi:hypothetical protein